jgi:hypothetical protein
MVARAGTPDFEFAPLVTPYENSQPRRVSEGPNAKETANTNPSLTLFEVGLF